MIIEELIQTAEKAGDYLNEDARRTVIKFVTSRWNADGGVRGKDDCSDLFYTAFAVFSLRALKGRMPVFRLWNYVRSFGHGESLDLAHFYSLVRLRTLFPMARQTRNRLLETLEDQSADSATDLFFKLVMGEYLRSIDHPGVHLTLSEFETTANLAAAVVINQKQDDRAMHLLMQRYCQTGGFRAMPAAEEPCLEATAKALYALRMLGADLSPMRSACLGFIESLRCDEGGYVGHGSDDVADTENTFYALFSIGCLAS